MATPDLPDALRAQLAKLEARPPLETVREFLLGHLADAESLTEVRARLRRIGRQSTVLHRRVLGATESVRAAAWPPGTLARLVARDANWVLDDPSDAGAARFLGEIAVLLRDVIAEAESGAGEGFS